MGISVTNAQTVYIRDVIYVPLRGGQSSEHRILHNGLRSGTRLELVEENTESGYSRVRTETGKEGWIPNQYLVSQPIAADLLDQRERRLKALDQEHRADLLRIEELENILARNTLTEESLKAKNIDIQEKLDTITQLSANAIKIKEENSQLLIERESLIANVDALDSAYKALEDDSKRQWFLYGAGVVSIAIIFGFWLARRIYHNNNSGGWA
ncbi:MAG: TIGR04211 family SH3 domain-containing protein [Candidatus Azotimanducaceae bacterium]